MFDYIGFLATSDVNPDLGNWGIRLKWLRELLQESPVRQQIIILDCCYSGELLNFDEADPGDRGKGRDRCFIAASREFEVAYEGIGNHHSVLSEALLQGLDPKNKFGDWITNYSVIETIKQHLPKFPQRPIFGNSGGWINLTRIQQVVQMDSSASLFGDICPYRGLLAFDCTEEDAQYFFGREALTDELLEKVRCGNFLAVLGASGTGKSSLVRAGLLYQLQQGSKLSGSENWEIKIFRPGEHPLESLALGFVDKNLSDIDRASQLAKAEELLAQGSQGLRRLVQVSKAPRVVLVVDQFEEAFTLCQDEEEKKKFFDCLLGVTSPLTPLLAGEGNNVTPPSLLGKGAGGLGFSIILTMRADFFGKCAEYGELAQRIQENLVTVTPIVSSRGELAQLKPRVC